MLTGSRERRLVQPLSHGENVGAQRVEARVVGLAPRADRQVHGRRGPKRRKQLQARQFAQAALQAIAVHCGVLMSRNHETDSGMIERGSDGADVEVDGPDSLPLSNDGLQIGSPRQPIVTRKSKILVMRRRICSEA